MKTTVPIHISEDRISEIKKEKCEIEQKESFERRQRIWGKLRNLVPKLAKQRREQFAKNAKYCRLCVLDAFQGRLSNGLANNSKKSWWIYTIFCIQTSEILFRSVMIACIFHTFSLFFEPENACTNSTIYTFLQILVVLIYAFDISLKMSYEGVQEYFRHDWQLLYAIVVVLCTIDIAVNHCTVYTNPLRPVVGVLRARKGRRFFEILKKMIPGMTHSLMPLLFFIVIVTVISAVVFDTTLRDLSNPIFTTYNWFFLIFTNDNFDRILPEEITLNLSYLIFFFPCIYIGQQFLLSLIIGDTYDIYKIYVKKQLKKEKLKEIQGLTKAFSVLDIDKTGYISYLQWRELCIQLNPLLSNECIALYFELISGGNPVITILQFLKIKNVLNFHLKEKKNKKALFSSIYLPIYDKISVYYRAMEMPIYTSITDTANTLLKLIDDYCIIHIINYIDIILLCLSQLDHIITTIPIEYRHQIYTINITISSIINILYIFEFFLYFFINHGKLYLTHKNNNITTNLFISGVIGRIIIAIIQHIYNINIQRMIEIPLPLGSIFLLSYSKIILLLHGFRCFRIINLNKDLSNFSLALLDVIPGIIETFIFSFIVTYIFGCMGHILFGSYIREWSSPLAAIVKTFKLRLMIDYLLTIENTMAVIHPITCVFFLFYLILSLIVSNIALSIIIELQNNILSNKTTYNHENNKIKLDLMFNKIKDQARLRAVFTNNNEYLNFSNIVMSRFQTIDTRHFITDINEEKEYFSIDDIKACQKYSNIDLLKFYYKEHRNNTEEHWEVDFLTSISDYGIKEKRIYLPGEVVFIAGECAKELFLVLRGSFIISEPNCMGAAFASASYFIGHETLTPSSKYQWQCAAETEAEVVVFKQKDFTEKLSNELCGTILRMSLKSYMKLETSLLESRKRSSRGISNASYSDSTESSCQEKGTSKSLHPEEIVGLPLIRETSFELLSPRVGLVRRGAHVIGVAPVLTKPTVMTSRATVDSDVAVVRPTLPTADLPSAVDP